MRTVDVVLVSADDWGIIYVDGKEEDQGHRTHEFLVDLIRKYKYFNSITSYYVNQEGHTWLEHQGRFPKKLEEIPNEYFA